MDKIQVKIQKANYVVTEHDIELLAASHFACDEAAKRADGYYLRVLITVLQAQFDGVARRKKITKADSEAHANLLTETHQRFYPFVLKGVTTADVADDATLGDLERRTRSIARSSRAGFARSTASTLLGFIRAGGDIRSLDVATITKTQLRGWTRQATIPGNNPKVDALNATVRRVETLARSLMASDPDEARNTLEDAMARFQRILDELGIADGNGNGGGDSGHTTTQPQLVDSAVFQGSRGARYRPRTQAA